MGFAILAALAVFIVSLWGWGWGVRRVFGIAAGSASLTLGSGLAGLIFLGGVLNLIRLADAPALLGLVAGGLVLAGFGRSESRAWVARLSWRDLAILVPVLLILTFTVATQLPPAAYNAADDYAKYFFHPVRMLATGTLFGSSMSDLGSETLGGKAFLDGFVVALFPLTALNVTDAVFGLLLCLLLAAQFSRGRGALVVVSGLGVLSVIAIDPQYMNISALYLGAALMMVAIALTVEDEKAAALGLVYAAMIALKTTFALFVVVHLLLVVMALAVARREAWFGARVVGWTVVFVSPWVLLHLPHYFSALTAPVNEVRNFGAGPREAFGLFSVFWLTYGSSFLQFTLTVLAGVVAALVLLWRSNARVPLLMGAVAGLTGAIAYLVMFYVFGPRLSGTGEATRYFVPFAIGTVPAVLGIAAKHLARGGWRNWVAIALAGLPVVIFAPSMPARAVEAVQARFILAFPFARTEDYRNLNTLVMSEAMAARVRKLQHMVPAGETLTVWINAPFALDLKRNPIIDMDPAGLATPWAALPASGYIIWEYGGYAMPMAPDGVARSGIVGVHERMIAGAELRFSALLERYAEEGALIFKDERFAVIRMPGS